MQYVVDAQSGVVKRFGSAGQDALDGERLVEIAQDVDARATYFVGDVPHTLPPRPNDVAAWDGSAWVDPRSEADLIAERDAWRSTATMTKLEFGKRAMQFGFLTPAEFADGMRGIIPASFAGAVAQLSPEMRDMAEGTWAGASQIDRLDPFILGVAAETGIDEDVLDLLFGWTGFGVPL